MTVHYGVWSSSSCWELEHVLRQVALDYVVADCQHGTWSQRELEQLFSNMGARSAYGCRPLVRTGIEPAIAEIGRYLDAGAWGLIVPYAADGTQLAEIRTAMRYPPRGRRSAARNIGVYNTGSSSLDEYIEWTRQRLTLTALVESSAALARLDEILDASDSVLFGLKDLVLQTGSSTDACLEMIGERLGRSNPAKPVGYLGIEPRQQQALHSAFINLGSVKDLVAEALTVRLQQLRAASS